MAAEGIEERDAIMTVVGRFDIVIGGDDGAQVVSKCDLDWWHVVERSNTHFQYMLGGPRCFACKAVDQIRMQHALGQNARSACGNTAQVADPRLIDFVEGIEDCADEDIAPGVGFHLGLVSLWIGQPTPPLAFFVSFSQRITETVRLTESLSNLQC